MKQPKDRRKEGPRNITVPKEKITDFSIMLIHVLKKHCQIHGNGLTHYQEKEKKGIFHIQHNDLSVIAQMKKILNEEFNIPIESIGYYGSTQDNIYMKLAEFDEKAREQVSDAFSHINSIVVKKAKAPIAGEGGSTESAEPVVKKQYTGARRGPKPKNKSSENSIVVEKRQLVNDYELKILSFLKYVLGFENSLKPFGPSTTKDDRLCFFNDLVEGTYHYLICRNDSVRDVAFEALSYALDRHNSPRVLLLGEKNTIFSGKIGINFRLMKHWKQENLSSFFCLPPKIGATSGEVRTRLERVCNDSPEVTFLGDLFMVSYQIKGTAYKMFSLTSGMGWNVSTLRENENDFMLDLRPVSFEKKKVELKITEVVPPPVAASIPPPEKVVKAEVIAPIVPSPVLESAPSNPASSTKTKEESYRELEKIQADTEYFSSLREETQQEIIESLQINFKYFHREEYARMLLDLLK